MCVVRVRARRGKCFFDKKKAKVFSLIRWGFLHMCLGLKRCALGDFHFSFVEAKLSGREKIAGTFEVKSNTKFKRKYYYWENHSSRKIGDE